MNRKTMGALLVFLGLLGIAYYLFTSPDKGVRVGEKPRPLPKMKAEQIKQISITAKGKTVVLVRKGKDTWRLSKPVDYPADKNAATSLVDKLKDLEFGDMVTELKAKHAEHEVDEGKGIHVVVSDGAKPLADFFVGKVMEGYTMLRAGGKDQVYQAVGGLRHVFEREIKNWRDRTILTLKQEEIRKLKVTAGAGEITLSRPDKDKPWKVDASTTPIDQLDKATVDRLLSSIQSLSAFDFADGAKAADTGLDKPRATVVASLAGGKDHTVKIGNSKGDDYWVQRVGDAQVFLLKKYTIENLLKRPLDFRDKTVLGLKAEDIIAIESTNKKTSSTVTVVRKGSDWLANGKKVTDAKPIDNALSSLSELKAEAFSTKDMKALGLDKPGWVIKIKMKDRTTHRLTVGTVKDEDRSGLVRDGLKEIFLFRNYTLDRIQLEAKDFKKGTPPPGPMKSPLPLKR